MPWIGPRIGLCGIGLKAHWPQFAGLRERLDQYLGHAASRLRSTGANLELLGVVDLRKRRAKLAMHVMVQISVYLSSTSHRTRSQAQCCRSCSEHKCRCLC